MRPGHRTPREDSKKGVKQKRGAHCSSGLVHFIGTGPAHHGGTHLYTPARSQVREEPRERHAAQTTACTHSSRAWHHIHIQSQTFPLCTPGIAMLGSVVSGQWEKEPPANHMQFSQAARPQHSMDGQHQCGERTGLRQQSLTVGWARLGSATKACSEGYENS